MSELFDKLMAAYKAGDENAFAAAARNWAEANNNPFKPGTKEHDLYFNACKSYNIWQSGAINARVSKQNMIKYMREIASMNLKNPYDKKKEKKIIVEPAEHVFGVIPTQKLEIVESDEVLPPEEDIEDQPKKKHHFFKKEGVDNDSKRSN